MKITNLLNEKTIDLRASGLDKKDIIEKAVKLISKSGS